MSESENVLNCAHAQHFVLSDAILPITDNICAPPEHSVSRNNSQSMLRFNIFLRPLPLTPYTYFRKYFPV